MPEKSKQCPGRVGRGPNPKAIASSPPLSLAIRVPVAFAPKVAVVNSQGSHLRFVPAALASALVDSGTVAPVSSNGRIREVSLLKTASSWAQRVGKPTGQANGVRFYRWIRLHESGLRIVEHHPRCLWKVCACAFCTA